MKYNIFIGLDVHKSSISVGVAKATGNSGSCQRVIRFCLGYSNTDYERIYDKECSVRYLFLMDRLI